MYVFMSENHEKKRNLKIFLISVSSPPTAKTAGGGGGGGFVLVFGYKVFSGGEERVKKWQKSRDF